MKKRHKQIDHITRKPNKKWNVIPKTFFFCSDKDMKWGLNNRIKYYMKKGYKMDIKLFQKLFQK